jgi:hypothetical protein
LRDTSINRRFKVLEKSGKCRISVQDPGVAGQAVKNPAIASQNLASTGQAMPVKKECVVLVRAKIAQ